ncbi:MAG: hypothetical protein F4051_04425 [Boseongicola sp. SB0670_bin_30]|nr:hypothetical protein [Boseongicola sp. SB0670_bin_30]
MNAQFDKRATGHPKGILGFEERPLASCDSQHDPHSAIVDGPSTISINGSQAKVYAWQDDEWALPTFMATRNMTLSAKGRDSTSAARCGLRCERLKGCRLHMPQRGANDDKCLSGSTSLATPSARGATSARGVSTARLSSVLNIGFKLNGTRFN